MIYVLEFDSLGFPGMLRNVITQCLSNRELLLPVRRELGRDWSGVLPRWITWPGLRIQAATRSRAQPGSDSSSGLPKATRPAGTLTLTQ
jgi:hypothetical protein